MVKYYCVESEYHWHARHIAFSNTILLVLYVFARIMTIQRVLHELKMILFVCGEVWLETFTKGEHKYGK